MSVQNQVIELRTIAIFLWCDCEANTKKRVTCHINIAMLMETMKFKVLPRMGYFHLTLHDFITSEKSDMTVTNSHLFSSSYSSIFNLFTFEKKKMLKMPYYNSSDTPATRFESSACGHIRNIYRFVSKYILMTASSHVLLYSLGKELSASFICERH